MGRVILGVLLVVVYFVPTGVAVKRRHDIARVALINTLLGWTGVGWFVALILACATKTQRS